MKLLSAANVLSFPRIVFLPLLFWFLLAGHQYWFLGAYILVGSTDTGGYFSQASRRGIPALTCAGRGNFFYSPWKG